VTVGAIMAHYGLEQSFPQAIFPDWPWFLETLRPEGFLGHGFARHRGSTIRAPDDLTRWSADDVLRAAVRFGEDMPGNFIVGDEALAVFDSISPAAGDVAAEPRRTVYDALATKALAGESVGSSAGGEQPKFCTIHREKGETRHLIVKFSPPRDSQAGVRWSELLACEHIALETLADAGMPASRARWHESDARCYLEVTRFDRIGARGRRGMVSLKHLDLAYYGLLDDWPSAADRLERDGWIVARDADVLRILGWFGVFIGNTDMHFGNVSLFLDDALPLALAPAYDMLPMFWRPTSTGEVVLREFSVSRPPPSGRPEVGRAANMAVDFWGRVERDSRISDGFRAVVRVAADYAARFARTA